MWLELLALSHILIVILFTLRVLIRDDLSSSARLAWIVVLLTTPYVGVVVYLLFGEVSLGHTIYRRHEEVFQQIRSVGVDALGNCRENLSDHVEARYHPGFLAASSADGFETTLGNRGELMPDAATARARLIADIDAATDHVNVLYYIWLNDDTGTNVAHALMRAAERGVKCRAMVDGLGSRAMVRSPLWKQMQEAGVETAVALPIKNLIHTILFSRLDLRNHRKIMVIDGRITYCGSQNCADPEFRVKPRFAPWVDIMVRFEGPVVAQNQLLFASDWLMNDPAAPLEDFPLHTERLTPGFAAQVFGDGPTQRLGVTPQLFATLLGSAQREILISTPYFVPDITVLNALCAAAYRGVEVTMVVPARNDSWIVSAASRSYYRRLLEAGVKLYEFRPGLLHAKTLTVDDAVTLIGSTNLDIRSFDLNYENDILFRDDALTADIKARQLEYLAQSDAVRLNAVLAWSPPRRIWNNVVATVGPIL